MIDPRITISITAIMYLLVYLDVRTSFEPLVAAFITVGIVSTGWAIVGIGANIYYWKKLK